MRPTHTNFGASDRMRDEILIQREIGNALRRSFGSVAQEPIPSAMALLLMQLAFAEVVRTLRRAR